MGVAMQEPVLIDLDAATTAVRPDAWLIDRVGDDGIKLTTAGYLPPVHVEAAFTELDLADARIGMGNREQLTIPVLHLRESAQRMGLLRKHRGRLIVTARGKAARSDPSALWFRLAERMPLASKDLCEEQAGLLFLIAVAAGENDPDGFVADMLDSIGWKHRDRAPITTSSAARITSAAHNEEHHRRAAAAPAAGTGQSSREAGACHTASGGVRPRRGAGVAIRRDIDTTVVILAGSPPYPRFAVRLST